MRAEPATGPAGPLGSIVEEEEGASPAAALNSFLRVVLRHRTVFVAVVLFCLFGAGAWLVHRTPDYRATADILVSPIPATDESFVGLPLIQASQLDPQRAAETAAPLLDSVAAARQAATKLEESGPGAVSSAVTVEAVPGSSLVEVTAEWPTTDGAAAVANAYAEAALQTRGRLLEPKVRDAIVNTEAQLESISDPTGPEASVLETRLAGLRSIDGRGDPTLELAREASPGAPQDAPPAQVLLVALIAGVLLAGLTVVMIELLVAQPINSEGELLRLYSLPVLARVPDDEAAFGSNLGSSVANSPPAVREAFRTLRDQLELRAADGMSGPGRRGSTVLMVSPERSAMRGGCSLHLARSFSSVHDAVAVVELDVGDPKISAMLEVDPPGSLSSLIAGASVESVAVSFDGFNGSRLVAAPRAVDLATREAITTRTAEIIDEARLLGDWVVLDAPPVTEEAADAVAALPAADFVVVVVSLGSTRPEALGLLRELFEQRGRRPDGYLVLTGGPATG
jgi:capsular polysaccharide biosynthesis protein